MSIQEIQGLIRYLVLSLWLLCSMYHVSPGKLPKTYIRETCRKATQMSQGLIGVEITAHEDFLEAAPFQQA